MEFDEFGICTASCNIILRDDTKVLEKLLPGAFVQIIEKTEALAFIKTCCVNKKDLLRSKNEFVCGLNFLKLITNQSFRLLLAIKSEHERLDMANDYKFINFIEKIRVLSNLKLNGNFFELPYSYNVGCQILYIGEVPEIGIGYYVGLYFVHDIVPIDKQQFFVSQYIPNCKKANGIIISLNFLRNHSSFDINYDTEPKNLFYNDNSIKPALSQINLNQSLYSPENNTSSLSRNDFEKITTNSASTNSELLNNSSFISYDDCNNITNPFSKLHRHQNEQSTLIPLENSTSSLTRTILENFTAEFVKINIRNDNFPETKSDYYLMKRFQNNFSLLNAKLDLKMKLFEEQIINTCPLCEKICRNPVTLTCKHNYCLDCIGKPCFTKLNSVLNCYFINDGIQCFYVIEQAEKRAILNKLIQQSESEVSDCQQPISFKTEPYLRSANVETSLSVQQYCEKDYYCQADDCNGQWIIDENDINSMYTCPLCNARNCVKCNAIHAGITCEDYQAKNKSLSTLGKVKHYAGKIFAFNQNQKKIGVSNDFPQIDGIYHCKTKNCNEMWCIDPTDTNNLFSCPKCNKYNCTSCDAIHEGITCKIFQEQKKMDFGRGDDKCVMCLEDKKNPKSIMKLEVCGHTICKNCLIKIINESETDAHCPFKNAKGIRCQTIITEDSLKKYLSNKDYVEYERKKHDNICKNYSIYKCKTTKCMQSWMLEENKTLYVCEGCGKINCTICEIIHLDVPCKEYQLNVIKGKNDFIKHKLLRKLTERQIEEHQLIIDGHVKDHLQASNAIKFINEYKEYEKDDIFWLVQQSNNQRFLKNSIDIECSICTLSFTRNKITAMVACTHEFCNNCITHFFTLKITEGSVVDLICPSCKEFSIDDAEENYFMLLQQVLKPLLEPNVFELFDKKIRDRGLMFNPNFKWCIKCENGFDVDPGERRIQCDTCDTEICALCEEIWLPEHNGRDCVQFAQWRSERDPLKNPSGLNAYLKENGIQCPACKTKYDLARGGCMHFKCTQCKHEFCGGCFRPFLLGAKCQQFNDCNTKGLHSHHPRNCAYYLRDMTIEHLEKLLKDNKTVIPPIFDSKDDHCKMAIQRDTPSGKVDDMCGEKINQNQAGLCPQHYTEYLCERIHRNKIDPIPIMNVENCRAEIMRNGFEVPQRVETDSDEACRQKYITVIQQNIPI